MRVAVVGHVEWVEFARVERVPSPGEIVHVRDAWEQPAGGGAVAAVQLARLAGECLFLTALGDDARGRRAKVDLEEMGVRVEAAWRAAPQRRAFVYLDSGGERTITVIGDRMGPDADDRLPWHELERLDAVYLTAGDPGAVRRARAATTLVATPRALDSLKQAKVELDVLVSSANDAGERYTPGELDPAPRLVARTDGTRGGSLLAQDGTATRWAAAPLPGPPVDAYGAGDSFAAGLTFGLAEGLSPELASAVGARCGAACAAGRGPYEGQITRSAAIAPNSSAR
jgi:ribokinase